jgi:hypothetical protein
VGGWIGYLLGKGVLRGNFKGKVRVNLSFFNAEESMIWLSNDILSGISSVK